MTCTAIRIAAVASADLFVYPLHLPQNAIVRNLRIYYKDTNVSADLTGYITAYDNAGVSMDLTNVSSSGNAGLASAVSPSLNYTVNDLDHALQIIVSFDTSDPSLLFCGARVSYDSIGDRIFAHGFEET